MARVKYNVEVVRQGGHPLCWLACAAMVKQHKLRSTVTTTEIGLEAGMDFRQNPQSVFETNNSYPYLTRLGFTCARSNNWPTPTTQLGGHKIYELLLRRGPAILMHRCGSFTYGADANGSPRTCGVPTGYHAVVMTGINTAENVVYFNNPWGQKDVRTTVSSIVNSINRVENGFSFAVSYL